MVVTAASVEVTTGNVVVVVEVWVTGGGIQEAAQAGYFDASQPKGLVQKVIMSNTHRRVGWELASVAVCPRSVAEQEVSAAKMSKGVSQVVLDASFHLGPDRRNDLPRALCKEMAERGSLRVESSQGRQRSRAEAPMC